MKWMDCLNLGSVSSFLRNYNSHSNGWQQSLRLDHKVLWRRTLHVIHTGIFCCGVLVYVSIFLMVPWILISNDILPPLSVFTSTLSHTHSLITLHCTALRCVLQTANCWYLRCSCEHFTQMVFNNHCLQGPLLRLQAQNQLQISSYIKNTTRQWYFHSVTPTVGKSCHRGCKMRLTGGNIHSWTTK